MDKLSIAKGFKWLRATLDLTQKELAKRAGLTPGFVSQVEMGRRSPRLNSLLRVSKATGIPIEVILVMGGDTNNGLVCKLQKVVEEHYSNSNPPE